MRFPRRFDMLAYPKETVAQAFNISVRKVGTMIESGQIRTIVLGEKTVRIPRDEIMRLYRDGLPIKTFPPSRAK